MRGSGPTLAYDVAVTSLGPLLLAASERGLVRLAFVPSDGQVHEEFGRLAIEREARFVRAPSALEEALSQIQQYLAGDRHVFVLALDLSGQPPFTRAVLGAASEIPYGETRSYTDVAAAAGWPSAVRATGNALGANPVPVVLPCHRVLRAGGQLGGYTGGVAIKRRLLVLEGASVQEADVVDRPVDDLGLADDVVFGEERRRLTVDRPLM